MSATRELGWILVHSVWLGAAVAVILWMALRATPRRDAHLRYLLAVGALGLQLFLPVATAWRGHDRAARQVAMPLVAPNVETIRPSVTDATKAPEVGAIQPPAATASAAHRAATARPAALVGDVQRAVSPFLPWIVRVWFAGVIVLALRLCFAWVHAERLRRRDTRPAPLDCTALVAKLAARLQVRRAVQVVESAAVEVPAVVGWLRPVLLVPASALAGLPARPLELLLAHELAHVRRHDALVNLVQCVVETLLFYHPAVWWVSETIRRERENCCDDIAIETTGDAHGYASALLALEERRAVAPRLVPAADGTAIGPRIRRLLEPRRAHAELPRWVPGTLLLSGALALVLAGRPWGQDDAFAAPPDAGDERIESKAEHRSTQRHAPLRKDQIRIHPAPQASLSERWDWAHSEARQGPAQRFWIGWSIAPLGFGDGNVFFGRLETEPLIGPDVVLSGRLSSFGDFAGFDLPGVRLPAELGAPDQVAVLLLCERRYERAPLRAQATSLKFPVDLDGAPLFWLGASADEPSLALLDAIDLQKKGTAEQRADRVALVGIHATSSLVVPRLVAFLDTTNPVPVRRDAAEWLPKHPDARGLAALTQAARRDPAADVRREAAESVGEMQLPAAGDSALALARTLQDEDARREAVESLGERAEPRTLDGLVELAYSDPNPDVQREAVETLGHRAKERGIEPLLDIARQHPDRDVRREAIETLGETLPPDSAEKTLLEFLRQEEDPDVQREIIATLAQTSKPDRVVEILGDVLERDPSEDACREAVESLAHVPGRAAGLLLIETARTHPNREIRELAKEALDGRPW